jgi:tRNA dimethylallyltransferase
VIAGPTASGKSALALALAERLSGTVINADSMQVYRELRILTARPTREEEMRAPHALYGFVPGSEAYSAARYAADAAAAIANARAEERVPIVVGGTGLYFAALLLGLSPIPPIDPSVRAYWRSRAMQRPARELHEVLSARDSVTAARLMPTDTQRIVRALEVLESTGAPLSEWQQKPGRSVLDERETTRLLVLPDRESMAARIGSRFDAMLAHGVLDEVSRLVALELSPELPIMRALGVAPLAAHLRGQMGLEEAAEIAKADTRQYARRQLTWLRRNMIAWRVISQQEMQRLERGDLSFIDS